MKIPFFQKILPFAITIAVVFVIHLLFFHYFKINTTNFRYSIPELYGWFSIFTFVIQLVLLEVEKRSFDNVGMSFLVITSLKMVACYVLLRPVLQGDSPDLTLEKGNFFFLFVFFLLIETLFTIRLVNTKKK